MTEKRISHCQGKGSLTHNNRRFNAKNVDSLRTKDNIIFVQQPISEAYEQLFGAAVERYNARQKRSDRKITTSYFEHVFKRPPSQSVVTSADKRKSFYEDVVQIGCKEDTGVSTPDAEIAVACLTEYMQGFQERNPNFFVFNAVLHLDEATPHLHIDYIPIGHYKQGVDTQNGLAQALKEMNFGVGKDAIARWRERECKLLTEICNCHGVKIAAPKKSRGSLTVEQYKEYAQVKERVDEKKKEVAILDEKAEYADKLLKHREEMRSQVEEIIDRLDEQFQEKNAQVRQLDTELAETSAALADNQTLLKESAERVAQIKAIDGIETGKTVFGGKLTVAKEDYAKLADLAKKQIAAENKENELTAEVARLKKENESLTADKESLTEQNSKLRGENAYLQSLNGRIAIAKLRSERDNVQHRLDRVMEFIKSLGLVEKLQAFLRPNKRLHR